MNPRLHFPHRCRRTQSRHGGLDGTRGFGLSTCLSSFTSQVVWPLVASPPTPSVTTPAPTDFSQTVQMSFNCALQGGKGGGGGGGAMFPRGSQYAMGCIFTSIPNIEMPNFIAHSVLPPKHQHKASRTTYTFILASTLWAKSHSLITMSQNHSSMLSPYNYASHFVLQICFVT